MRTEQTSERHGAPAASHFGRARPAIIRFELSADLMADQSASDPVVTSAPAMVAQDNGAGVITGQAALTVRVHSPGGGHLGFASHGYGRGSMGYAIWNQQAQRWDILSLQHKVWPGVLQAGNQLSLYRRDSTSSYLADSGTDATVVTKLAIRDYWIPDQFEVLDRVLAQFDQQYHYWYLSGGPMARTDHTH